MAVTITKDNLANLLASVKELTGKEVLVGIPDSTTGRSDPKSPVTNAMLGYIHELGSPARNIPARPFLAPGIANARDAIVQVMRKTAEATFEPNGAQEIDKGLNRAGLIAVSSVRKRIVDGPFVPLAPLTLARRAARVGKSVADVHSKPLIDTGKLLASITYVIRKKKKQAP